MLVETLGSRFLVLDTKSTLALRELSVVLTSSTPLLAKVG